MGVVYLLPTNNKMLLSAYTCRSICFYTGWMGWWMNERMDGESIPYIFFSLKFGIHV